MKTEKRTINNDTQMIEAVKEACDHYCSKVKYNYDVSINIELAKIGIF